MPNKYHLGQEVFIMRQNQIQSGQIHGIHIVGDRNFGVAFVDYVIGSALNPGVRETEVFATKEELIAHLSK